MRIGKLATMLFVVMVLVAPAMHIHAQAPAPSDEAQKNAEQARAALDAMVKALGGQAWLDLKNQVRQEHIAAFYQGNPDPGTDGVIQFPPMARPRPHRGAPNTAMWWRFLWGAQGWEVTYRGKKPLDKDIVDDYLRRRDHSIETAVKVWLKDPNTILVYEGQRMSERHLAEQVTLISPQNESITILMDVADASAACAHLRVARPHVSRQEHRHRGVRRLSHHRRLPYGVQHHAAQEWRHGAPVLLVARELQPEFTRGFLGSGCGGAQGEEVARGMLAIQSIEPRYL